METAQERFPDEEWLHYAEVGDAGFSPSRLARARKYWEHRDSSAFLVVSRGAVVASWGEIDRRFMCHSVRKSFLSALYGIYRNHIDLEMTLAELGIDDEPALTVQEKQARILDLISSRSGVYHQAAAEPNTMSKNRPARGSHEPGRHWWYNNWDFNAAGTIFEQLTGEPIFEAFHRAIAEPIDMQDYDVSHGFYHYERRKSVHPGYMFRMSTRDLARFGLLFARGGRWKDRQIVPNDWVRESTRAHSEVDMGSKYGSGYGYMWWIEETGFTARGSGGHILAVYPDQDLVMVLRADTYHDKSVPARAAMRLFDMVAEAGRGTPVDTPRLVRAPTTEKAPAYTLSVEQLNAYPTVLEMPSSRKVTVSFLDDMLAIDYGYGTFHLQPESDTRFIAEDSRDPVLFELDGDGRVTEVWAEQLCYLEAAAAVERDDIEAAVTWVRHAVDKFPESSRAHFNLARALHGTGKSSEALLHVQEALELDSRNRGASRLLTQLRLRQAGRIGLVLILGLPLTLLAVRRLYRFQPTVTARAACIENGWPTGQLTQVQVQVHGSGALASTCRVDFHLPEKSETLRVTLHRRFYSPRWRAVDIELKSPCLAPRINRRSTT